MGPPARGDAADVVGETLDAGGLGQQRFVRAAVHPAVEQGHGGELPNGG
jgi:hypothetical protein